MVRFGYACINETLAKQGIKTNRGAIKRTFQQRGIEYVSELALSNSIDLLKILEWNESHGISLYRISSDIFPWASEYDIDMMPNIDMISRALQAVGDYAKAHGHRLSFHPGQFNCMASPNESVIVNSLKDLEMHAKIADLIGMPKSPQMKINIHIGGAYGDREAAMERFCRNFERLSDSVRSRLTVENDDKPNCFSTLMLCKGIHKRIGIPVVFDSHHFELGPQDQDYADALCSAAETWGSVTPACHHSNSKRDYEDKTASKVSHSDWYYTPFNSLHFKSLDVMLECKRKEQAVLKYRNDFVERDKVIAA